MYKICRQLKRPRKGFVLCSVSIGHCRAVLCVSGFAPFQGPLKGLIGGLSPFERGLGLEGLEVLLVVGNCFVVFKGFSLRPGRTVRCIYDFFSSPEPWSKPCSKPWQKSGQKPGQKSGQERIV